MKATAAMTAMMNMIRLHRPSQKCLVIPARSETFVLTLLLRILIKIVGQGAHEAGAEEYEGDSSDDSDDEHDNTA